MDNRRHTEGLHFAQLRRSSTLRMGCFLVLSHAVAKFFLCEMVGARDVPVAVPDLALTSVAPPKP